MRKRKTKNNKNRSLQQIASRALRASVVLAEIEQTARVTNEVMKGTKVAAGSGFFVAPHLIATNIHCVVGTTWVFAEPVSLPDTYPIARAIKLKPDFSHAYHQRGLAKQALGQQKEADTDFAKAMELDPDLKNTLDPKHR